MTDPNLIVRIDLSGFLLSLMLVVFLMTVILNGCGHVAHPAPAPAHLVVPPQCIQSMTCKSDAEIRNGKFYCDLEVKYSCTKVKK